MSHTPGPWHVYWGTKYPYIKDSRDYYILDHCGRSAYARYEADARLIAAAPDLLSACFRAYAELLKRGPLKPEEAMPGTYPHELMLAITKATGGAQ